MSYLANIFSGLTTYVTNDLQKATSQHTVDTEYLLVDSLQATSSAWPKSKRRKSWDSFDIEMDHSSSFSRIYITIQFNL